MQLHAKSLIGALWNPGGGLHGDASEMVRRWGECQTICESSDVGGLTEIEKNLI